MKQILVVLGLLLMTGCATVEELRTQKPDAVLRMKLPPEEAAVCMTRNLERIHSGYRTDRRPGFDGGIEAVTTFADGTLFTVTDLKAQANGSVATMRLAGVPEFTKKGWIEKITAGC